MPLVSFYNNIPISSAIPYCVYGTKVRMLSTYKGEVSYDDIGNYDIVIGFHIRRSRLNRQDLFNKVITIGYTSKYSNGYLCGRYDHMFEYSLLELIIYITSSLDVSYNNIYISRPIIKLQISDTVLDCSKLLEYTMLNDTTLFPRERNNISKISTAKLVHLESQSNISVRNSLMDSVTLSIKYNIPLASNYLLITIKILDNAVDDADKIVCDIVSFMLNIASDNYYIDSTYAPDIKYNISSIKYLRSIAHDLFVQRFSRESPKDMIISSDDDIGRYIDLGYNSLRYEGRWYVSLDKSMYVGLKINRLSNRDKYKYIPTLYRRDHSIIPGTNTYNYINNITVERTRNASSCNTIRELYPLEIGKAPNCVLNILSGNEHDKCVRIGLPSSISKLFNIDRVDDKIFTVAKQELPYFSSDDIRKIWYEDNNWHHIADLYRIIEEIYDINVIIIKDIGDDIELIRYDHLFRYIWNPKHGSNMLLLLKTRLNEYKIGYEIICYSDEEDNNIFIDSDKYLYKYLICDKISSCARYNKIDINDVKLQYLNSEGKCICYLTHDDVIKYHISAPLAAKYIDISSLPSYLDNNIYHHREQPGIISYDIQSIDNNILDRGYDDVVVINSIRYYRSEILPVSYVPQAILDIPDYYKSIVSNEEYVSGILSIVCDGHGYYRYYLAVSYIDI